MSIPGFPNFEFVNPGVTDPQVLHNKFGLITVTSCGNHKYQAKDHLIS